jgi:uncharacterized protein GlcG (DUF336 family)
MIKSLPKLALLAAGTSLSANAQHALSDFVVTGAAADKILDRQAINLETAERITMTCERLATERGVAISVYVLDNDGNHVYIHRMDGQVWTNIATAEMKARTALALREPSKAQMNRAIRDPNTEWVGMDLGLFANAGGLPIIVDNVLIGAIGVGGSAPRINEGWSDELCAHNAMIEVLGPQPPVVEDIPRPRGPATVPVPRFTSAVTPQSSLPAEWVVSGDAAKRIFDANQISGDAARRVARSCRNWAAERGETMSLFVLAPSGDLVHGERMDGQVSLNMTTALRKAETALRSRSVTSFRHAAVTNNQGGFPRAVALFDFYSESGGLPIVVDGQMIGAVGVSGTTSGEDEACAVEGLRSVFGDRVAVPVYPE